MRFREKAAMVHRVDFAVSGRVDKVSEDAEIVLGVLKAGSCCIYEMPLHGWPCKAVAFVARESVD